MLREVERAANTNSTIIPFRIEPVPPSKDLEFYVSASHWLDAYTDPFEKHLAALLDAINRRRHRDTPRPPPQDAEPTRLPSRKPWKASAVALAIVGLITAGIVGGIFVFSKKRDLPEPIGAFEPAPDSPQPTPPSVVEKAHPTNASTAALTVQQSRPITADQIREVTASSQRKPIVYYGVKTYEPGMAFDGDESTAWVGSTTDGAWIAVRFKSPARIESVSIFGGLGADVPRYKKNNRVEALRISFGDGSQKVVQFEDRMRMQRFKLARPVVTESVKFEILSVFRGTKFDDTPISEIGFNQPDSDEHERAVD